MKTVFKCEFCGSVSETQSFIEQCESDCKRLKLLKSVLDYGDGWNPPLTMSHFARWSRGDQMELLRRITAFIKKDQSSDIISDFYKKTYDNDKLHNWPILYLTSKKNYDNDKLYNWPIGDDDKHF